jgi:LPXTG-motif cell wall-anchored protein
VGSGGLCSLWRAVIPMPRIHISSWLCAIPVLIAAMIGSIAMAPGLAEAGAGAGAAITFPTLVTVGQTGLPASVDIYNFNTGDEALLTNSVCNAGDVGPPCGSLIHGGLSPSIGIYVTPSCAGVVAGQCMTADPGVFKVSPTALGRNASSCAGMSFDTAVVEPIFGIVNFTPFASAHVQLPAFGSKCTVDFTIDVVKAPTIDQDPVSPGIQTLQDTAHGQWVGTGNPNPVALNSGAQASSASVTVLLATTSVDTTASGTIVVGSAALTDTAVVSGRVAPLAGATVDFRLYGPNVANCSGPPVFQSLGVPYPVGGGPVASAGYTPSVAGTYVWQATYSGDANNLGAVGLCNDPAEAVLVSPPTTTTTTTTPPTTTTQPETTTTQPETTTTAPPIVVASTTTTTTIPPFVPVDTAPLPETGTRTTSAVPLGIGLSAGGVLLIWASRRRRPIQE